MSFFKGQLLHHFKHLKPALEQVGADAFLNVRSFSLEVRLRGAAHVFHPQFIRYDERGLRSVTSEFQPDIVRFAGWTPYFGKRWTLAIEKLKLKEYAVKNKLLTPPYWTDPGADVQDVVIKQNVSVRGGGARGPYRSSRESKLDVRSGEYYERFVRGKIVKAWFWEGRPVCCEMAEYSTVCGDGRRSIRELVLRQVGKAAKFKADSLREFLAYEGKSLDSRPGVDEVQPVDFRYGSRLGFLSEVKDVDLRRTPFPGVDGQLREIGACLLGGIPESLRANTAFTLDAVLDSEQRVWALAMDGDSFLHPYLYAPMIETWAKDPEGSLRSVHEPRELVGGGAALQ